MLLACVIALAAGCDRLFDLRPVPDGRAICFADDFTTDVIDSDHWTSIDDMAGSTVAQTGARLVFTLAANVSYAEIYSPALDLTDTAIELELIQAPPVEDGYHEFGMEIANDSDNAYTLFSAGGDLFFRQRVMRSNDDTMIQLNVTHRYLRIRHESASATVHFETSSDNSAWIDHRSVAATVVVSLARAKIYAGTYQVPAQPSTAVFDDFQLTGRCPPL